MEKVIKITEKESAGNDKEFWAGKSHIERLEALESLRQQYLEYTNAPQTIEKVYRIVSMKQKNDPYENS